jgi:hypothetical protein
LLQVDLAWIFTCGPAIGDKWMTGFCYHQRRLSSSFGESMPQKTRRALADIQLSELYDRTQRAIDDARRLSAEYQFILSWYGAFRPNFEDGDRTGLGVFDRK